MSKKRFQTILESEIRLKDAPMLAKYAFEMCYNVSK